MQKELFLHPLGVFDRNTREFDGFSVVAVAETRHSH
jgi:hypothetical protein